MGRKTHSVIWGLMEQRGTTDDNFKQLYSHISQIRYHITVIWTSYNWTSPFTFTLLQLHLQLHYNSLTTHDSLWREEKIIMELLIINKPDVILFTF